MSPQLGAFGVVATGGWQAWCIRKVTRSPVNHAFLFLGDDDIVEGDPKGAQISPVTKYPDAVWSTMPLTDVQREWIAAHGFWHVGTPYSWLDDAAIGLADIFGHKLPPLIRRFLSRKDRLMCSQLVDVSYQEAGVHLFDDDRLPGDVSPGDLYDLIRAAG